MDEPVETQARDWIRNSLHASSDCHSFLLTSNLGVLPMAVRQSMVLRSSFMSSRLSVASVFFIIFSTLLPTSLSFLHLNCMETLIVVRLSFTGMFGAIGDNQHLQVKRATPATVQGMFTPSRSSE